jgi:hypothetical protein
VSQYGQSLFIKQAKCFASIPAADGDEPADFGLKE